MQVVTRVFPDIERVDEGHAAFLMIPRRRWRALSEMLDSEVYCGRPIRWKRGPGFWDATFEVLGPPKHVAQVEDRVTHWFNVNGWL